MADIIQLLPDHVANQIAAGEVVQRPASVVKELLENAIDAGASEIQLIVKDAGRTLIQVVDNGSGMSPVDARLSFERHSTSKIKKAEDLFRLHTKGFRGEALASIAAIAHVELQSRERGEELGTLLKIEGSSVVSQDVVAAAVGTSVSVKNLFFNIPARRNFLKSQAVELRHITDEFHRVVLAHPMIAFTYHHNGNLLFNLKKAEPRQRIVQVFGRKSNEKLVPVTEQTQLADISGFVCKPEYAKKSRGEQFFFVNDRFIKSPFLNHAVLSAFEGLIKPDYHPGYFLFLQVAPESIDINIHPTKTEVKFEDEHSLYAVLRSAVKHSLGQFNVAPVLDFNRDQNLDTPYHYSSKEVQSPSVSVDANFNPFKTDTGRVVSKRAVQNWESLYVGMESQLGMEKETPSHLEVERDAEQTAFFDSEDQQNVITTFQLGLKYIVTSIKSGLLLIHQNRAHQRVLYERLLSQISSREAICQRLLFPLTLNFSPREMLILEQIEDCLIALGFVFGKKDTEQIELEGIPNLMKESEVQPAVDQLIAEYEKGLDPSSFSQGDMVAKTLSKALAVKSGEVLAADSQLSLVNDLFACKELYLSPFNKTIFTTIASSEIDKMLD